MKPVLITVQMGMDSIGGAVSIAHEMANRYECRVVFKFNSVECVMDPGDEHANMVNAYMAAAADESAGNKIAFGNGTYDITV